MASAFRFKSKKAREWVWWVVGAVAIVAIIVLASNASFTNAPSGSESTNVNAEENKTEETKTTSQPASAPRGNDVYSVADGLSDGGVFTALLANTGVSSMLQSGNRYTIFLPTNAAMARVDMTSMTGTQKKRLAEYHIIAGKAVDVDALNSGTVTALSRDPLNFTTVNGQVRVNSSRIISSHTASNGVIYLIDSVLLPPQLPR